MPSIRFWKIHSRLRLPLTLVVLAGSDNRMQGTDENAEIRQENWGEIGEIFKVPMRFESPIPGHFGIPLIVRIWQKALSLCFELLELGVINLATNLLCDDQVDL